MSPTNYLYRAWGYALRKHPPHDGVVEWIRMINPGMLHQGNLYLFHYCVNNLPSNAPFVEIGSFAGLSSNLISHYLRDANKTNELISADPWEFEGTSNDSVLAGSRIAVRDYRALVMETFARNVGLFSGDRMPKHIPRRSDDFFDMWAKEEVSTDFFGKQVKLGGPISSAFIDGDHSYEQSLKDFRNVDRFLEVGGFVIFDDSADWSNWGSRRSAREAAKLDNYRLVAKNPNYCIQKIK